jgi:hypothetical protein
LPDGLFSNQKSEFRHILEGLVLKKVGILLYGHFEYITAIWYIFGPFGNIVAIWYISPCFGILNKEKSGNPAYIYVEPIPKFELSYVASSCTNYNNN